MHTEELIVMVLVPAVLLTFAWVAWVFATNVRRARASRHQAELHGKLLDKLGSSPDLLTYLETDAGRRMLQSVGDQVDPGGRILGAMHTGVVLLMLGIGFLVCDGSLPGAHSVGVFLTLGIVCMSAGAGFLISSGLSYVFSKQWGLLRRPDTSRD
jgi:membrane protein implicated in regulation of membrane protease activity